MNPGQGQNGQDEVAQVLAEIEEQFAIQLKNYRAAILRDVELVVASSEQWPELRRRLLHALGERGLEGRLMEILDRVNHKRDQGYGHQHIR